MPQKGSNYRTDERLLYKQKRLLIGQADQALCQVSNKHQQDGVIVESTRVQSVRNRHISTSEAVKAVDIFPSLQSVVLDDSFLEFERQ